ncbi:hypothetical protein BH11PSE3_BH11PSE3_47170 [soil metagenome]
MVDDDGTSISLAGINIHRQWTMEYGDKAVRLKFRFLAYRNEPHDIARNPILPPSESWIVPFSYWLLATAIYAKLLRDAERLADEVRDKIKAALLAWPLDPDLNTARATDVSIRMTTGETLAEVQFKVIDARSQEKARRRGQLIRAVIALVVVHFLLQWLGVWGR